MANHSSDKNASCSSDKNASCSSDKNASCSSDKNANRPSDKNAKRSCDKNASCSFNKKAKRSFDDKHAICSMPKKELTSIPLLTRRELDYLNSERSLSRKLHIMADMLSLTVANLKERKEIVKNLYILLRRYYPACEIYIFGSSANGFGFRNCDLDLLFLPFPEYCNLDFKDYEKDEIPIPSDVKKGIVSTKDLYCMSDVMHLKFIQQIMYSSNRDYEWYFKKIFFIPAKCPILSIHFTYSHIQCDFSSSNKLVLHNTQLLWVYGELDSRVKHLVMFLRYWAKSLSFIAKSRLSSYCMSLLVVFYLQNTHPAILPSVKFLNQLAGYSRVIDGWETAICIDPRRINANQFRNSKSLSELLIGFFDFYWNFDFVQNVVSVHDGEPLPVKLIPELKDERIRTFQVIPFSVQDPFILSKNLSRDVTMKTSFKLSLMIAKNLCLQRHSDFELLFDSTYYQDEINSIFAPTKRKLEASSVFSTLQMTYEMHKNLAITSYLKPWHDKVSQGVKDIFQHALLMDCEIVDKGDNIEAEPPYKRRKFNIDDIGDLKLITSIQCIVNFPTFCSHNRKDVLVHLKKTDPNFELEDTEDEIPACLKTEYKISKELSKDEIKNVTKLPNFGCEPPYFSFTCNCYIYSESQISDIVFSYTPLSNVKNFNKTKEFLRTYLLKYIKTILKEA